MTQDTIVMYHGDCPSGDGFASALAAWLRLGGSASYVPVNYFDTGELPDVTDKDVFILDFSFEESVLGRLAAQARSLTLLDHHQKAKDLLQGKQFVCACHRPARLLLDTSQAGCVLSWRHFHPESPLPKLFRHVQDRDLWKWELDDSRAYLARLDLEPRTFEHWAALLQKSPAQEQQWVQEGRWLLKQREVDCERMAANAYEVTVAGARGLAVNAPHEWANDVGSLLSQRHGTFALVWFATRDGRIKCSLRSEHNQVDVDQLARPFGGGGHPGAAGFYLPRERGAAVLQGCIEPESNL